MASTNDIKRRRNSISSTQQITKAMKLVSTVKLQHSKQEALMIHSYFNYYYKTISSMLSKTKYVDSPFLKERDNGKCAVIVISSNRGLAGGYNANIAREVMKQDLDKDNTIIYSIGHKATDILKNKGFEVNYDFNDLIETPEITKATELCKHLVDLYLEGSINKIYIAYTEFKNTVVHIPHFTLLMPFDINVEITSDDTTIREENDKTDKITNMNFEIDEVDALDILIPQYISAMIYASLVEAQASEHGARMQAMDSATSNADEMIEELTLLYNRVRQGSITQEITEIIAGSEAI